MFYVHFFILLQEDEAKGLIPMFVCATVGTTSTAAVDSLSLVWACKEEKWEERRGGEGQVEVIEHIMFLTTY